MALRSEALTTEVDREVSGASRAIRAAATGITGDRSDYAPLLERIGQSRIVMIGEATHGTEEFYAERARITRLLIEELGFTAVAIEGDWPDSWPVNRYVRGLAAHDDPERALGAYRRFPTWMWRNTVVMEFISWLRSHNASIAAESRRVGFYGLDLYSLYESIEAVIEYLERVDPRAASRARERYSCFEAFGTESVRYGREVSLGVGEPCRREAVAQLVALQRHAADWLRRDGFTAEDDFLHAEVNARTVSDAEEYYRSMFTDPQGSWNLRDRHMADTLDRLVSHLDAHGEGGGVVVWAHNSHVGDSRATEMSTRGEFTLGRFARERHGGDVVLVGMTTHRGSVTAANDWGLPGMRRHVQPALEGSVEHLLHSTGLPAFLLVPRPGGSAHRRLTQRRLERAIGVVYRPRTERESHYRWTHLAAEFDAVIHIDQTNALKPLENTAEWHRGEPPETFPSAL